MKLFRLLAVTLGCLLFSAYASAGVVYENGAFDGTFQGAQISPPQEVSDSFTLAEHANLTRVTLGLWSATNSAPLSLTWSIGSSPFGNDLGSGSASLSSSLVLSYPGFDVYLASFDLNLALEAGDYWLTLADGASTGGQALGWDINFGPSQAFYRAGTDTGPTDSEYFRLEATEATVPEPASLVLFGAGLLGVVAARRRSPRAA
jgi:hypothetical protein